LLLVLWSPLIESSDICSWCDDANQLLLLFSIFIHLHSAFESCLFIWTSVSGLFFYFSPFSKLHVLL
jgi:hypothetical protein